MSYLKVLLCKVCLKHGNVGLSTKSVLLKIGDGSLSQQLARISTTQCNNKIPITTQIQTTATIKNKVAQQDNRMWKEIPSVDRKKNIVQYSMMLSKFRLTSLVVMTSMAGYALAPAPFNLVTFAVCAAGTGLVSSAANAINQYHEVPFDAQMSRTKNRVLVKGLLETAKQWYALPVSVFPDKYNMGLFKSYNIQVTCILGTRAASSTALSVTIRPAHAISFAAITSATGLSLLYFGVNPLTAALGATNLVLYTSVYTPMKRMSILNTWLGSVVGAIPPLMGWAGCTGGLDTGALVLAAVLYSWQFPHFNALSWNLRPDYSRAGYRMMAVTDPALCRRVALRHTGVITATCLASPYLGVTNMWFALESLPLNIYFMYLAWQFYKKSDSSSSRKLFRFSLVHLPALMLLMLVNKKYWASSETQEQETKMQDLSKLPDSKRITVLPRGPVVTAQDSDH